jgi:hypothetical protein
MSGSPEMKVASILLPAILMPPLAGPVFAAEVKPRVYALCTVRDLAFDHDKAAEGKVYRSEVFSVREDYDSEISAEPEKASKASAEFEQFIFSTYGLRADRSAMKGRSEHYCIEARDTPEGRRELETARSSWDVNSFPRVELVLTDFIPAAFKPSDRELEFQAKQREYGEARAQYERELLEHQEAKAKFEKESEAAARSAVEAQRALEAYQAELARNQAAYEAYLRQIGGSPSTIRESTQPQSQSIIPGTTSNADPAEFRTRWGLLAEMAGKDFVSRGFGQWSATGFRWVQPGIELREIIIGTDGTVNECRYSLQPDYILRSCNNNINAAGLRPRPDGSVRLSPIVDGKPTNTLGASVHWTYGRTRGTFKLYTVEYLPASEAPSELAWMTTKLADTARQ